MIVLLLSSCAGNIRCSGVVKMLKVDWMVKNMRETPKVTQSAIGPAESQDQVDPLNVITIMKSAKVDAFKKAPAQSI